MLQASLLLPPSLPPQLLPLVRNQQKLREKIRYSTAVNDDRISRSNVKLHECRIGTCSTLFFLNCPEIFTDGLLMVFLLAVSVLSGLVLALRLNMLGEQSHKRTWHKTRKGRRLLGLRDLITF